MAKTQPETGALQTSRHRCRSCWLGAAMSVKWRCRADPPQALSQDWCLVTALWLLREAPRPDLAHIRAAASTCRSCTGQKFLVEALGVSCEDYGVLSRSFALRHEMLAMLTVSSHARQARWRHATVPQLQVKVCTVSCRYSVLHSSRRPVKKGCFASLLPRIRALHCVQQARSYAPGSHEIQNEPQRYPSPICLRPSVSSSRGL